ncbi:MAG: carbohydrate kinase family protein [bacterium]|nr:carbohydrate kinase family protein [bacterium]
MMKQYDIITFGSATKDIFFRSNKFKTIAGKKFTTGKGICLTLGSKIEADEMVSSSGGGGTNTAATFAKQGFSVAFCGVVGRDLVGDAIVEELEGLKINTQLIIRTDKKLTDCSVILLTGARERTILIYHGASGEIVKNNIPWNKLKADWFYIAPLSGKYSLLTDDLINFAQGNGIKIAFNPGKGQILLLKDKFKNVFKKIDILFLNQEEAAVLTGIPYEKEKEIFAKIIEFCPGIVVMTKGERGVIVSDGNYLYEANALGLKPVDVTGAGDSFASGFTSGFMQKKGNVEYAIQLGMANSASCLRKIGAKNGLLEKGDKWKKVKVEKTKHA